MPTYMNETKRRIDWWGEVWQPNEAKALKYFVPYQLLGLTVANEEPYVLRSAPQGYGRLELEVSDEPLIYHLPYSESVEISISFKGGDTGEVKVFVGDSETPIIVTENIAYISHYPWALSAYITLVTDGDVIPVVVTVEPYTGRGTEKGRHN